MKRTKINTMGVRYNEAKKAKVGDEITCPTCGKKHIKTTYHKIFCSNYKARGRHNCKDNFWNRVDPEKRCRKTPYFEDVILERFAKDRGFPTYADLAEDDLNDDQSWDAHGGAELSICNCCHLRADFCRCGEGLDMID
jgi:hypothetical protein